MIIFQDSPITGYFNGEEVARNLQSGINRCGYSAGVSIHGSYSFAFSSMVLIFIITTFMTNYW